MDLNNFAYMSGIGRNELRDELVLMYSRQDKRPYGDYGLWYTASGAVMLQKYANRHAQAMARQIVIDLKDK